MTYSIAPAAWHRVTGINLKRLFSISASQRASLHMAHSWHLLLHRGDTPRHGKRQRYQRGINGVALWLAL